MKKTKIKKVNIVLPVGIVVTLYVFIMLFAVGSITFWLFSEALFEQPPGYEYDILIHENIISSQPINTVNDSLLFAQNYAQNNWSDDVNFRVITIYYTDFEKTINESAVFRYRFYTDYQKNNELSGWLEVTVNNASDSIEKVVGVYTTTSKEHGTLQIGDMDDLVNYIYDKWLIDLEEKNLTVDDCKKLIITIDNYLGCKVRTFTNENTEYGAFGDDEYYDINIDYTELDLFPSEE